MGSLEKKVEMLSQATGPVSFNDVKQICDYFFGSPRIHGSHGIYRMPWAGDPRINIQNRKGKVALYQVRQVLKALAKLEEEK